MPPSTLSTKAKCGVGVLVQVMQNHVFLFDLNLFFNGHTLMCYSHENISQLDIRERFILNHLKTQVCKQILCYGNFC